MPVAVKPLSYADLTGFLGGLLTAAGLSQPQDFPAFYEGPYIVEMPNRICTLTLQSGAGYAIEGAADMPQFQVRIRSEQSLQATAETDAFLLDQLIFQARYPTKLASGMNLSFCGRIGGAPAPLGPPDQAYRFDYTCNYQAVVGVRNV